MLSQKNARTSLACTDLKQAKEDGEEIRRFLDSHDWQLNGSYNELGDYLLISFKCRRCGSKGTAIVE